jgi:hypothetical protein
VAEAWNGKHVKLIRAHGYIQNGCAITDYPPEPEIGNGGSGFVKGIRVGVFTTL